MRNSLTSHPSPLTNIARIINNIQNPSETNTEILSESRDHGPPARAGHGIRGIHQWRPRGVEPPDRSRPPGEQAERPQH